MLDGPSLAMQRAQEAVETARTLREEARLLRAELRRIREAVRRERARLRTYPDVVEQLRAVQNDAILSNKSSPCRD